MNKTNQWECDLVIFYLEINKNNCKLDGVGGHRMIFVVLEGTFEGININVYFPRGTLIDR